ncbi:MAG: hypothetical protein HXY40_10990 [Chloroflexi bacterium]|nr:hypothetical protein [Chloroflexota bacterium]
MVAAGRRFGKTHVGLVALLQKTMPGRVGWWLSPTYGMAEQVWRDLKNLLGDAHRLNISESGHRIDMANGGVIAIRSSHNPDHLRGAGLDFVVLDEAAFMTPDVWPEIIQPMLLERKGGALFLSSPNGLNWFWQVYQMGVNNKRSWRAFHFTSLDNPLIDAAELEALRLNSAERVWREEYLAEFMSDSGQVFRGVRAAATVAPDTQPQPDKRYIAGLDWARDNDYTCMAVMEYETRRLVALERFHGVGYALQRDRVKQVCERWRPAVVWAESNSMGGPNIEALQAEGLPIRPFVTSASSKAPLIEALALAVERAQVALLPDEVLLGELSAYRMERLPGGGYRYMAPPGGHDDTVIALALAWHGVHHGLLTIDFL